MQTACLKPLHSDAACTSMIGTIPIDARHFHPTFLMVQKPPFSTFLACLFYFSSAFPHSKKPPGSPDGRIEWTLRWSPVIQLKRWRCHFCPKFMGWSAPENRDGIKTIKISGCGSGLMWILIDWYIYMTIWFIWIDDDWWITMMTINPPKKINLTHIWLWVKLDDWGTIGPTHTSSPYP